MKQNGIVLIGMPGSGKTTVGRILAKRLALSFVDLDAEVERAAGKSIPAIFADGGEEVFRRMETACAREAALPGRVISTGGGIVLRKENMEALSAAGTVVFLDRSVEEICSSDLSGRPLIGADRSRVQTLYDRRIGLYRRWAEITVGNHGTPEEAADAVISLLEGEKA